VVEKIDGDLAPGILVGDVIVRVDPRYFRPAEVETLLGDPSKAKQKLGWTPEISPGNVRGDGPCRPENRPAPRTVALPRARHTDRRGELSMARDLMHGSLSPAIAAWSVRPSCAGCGPWVYADPHGSRDELDLLDPAAVQAYFARQRVDQVYLAAAKVGGIHANATYPADFIYQNLMIQANVIHAAHSHGVSSCCSSAPRASTRCTRRNR
jgi:nucleoside-diphosphate-sugar epimerase